MDRYDITIQMLGVEASGPQYVWEKVPAEEGELVLYTDAQATIAALQARVKELEDGTSALLNQQSERLAVENEKLTMALFQLTQRTAELEAANHTASTHQALWREACDQRDKAQAELERVRSLIKALPKVEGEVTVRDITALCWANDGTYGSINCKEQLVSLLKHRQGMEG